MALPYQKLSSRDLSLVVAIVDHGSLRRTAQACGQTVAATSKHLRQLESRVSVALFHRTTVGMTPTVAGHELAAAGRRILAEIDAAFAALAPASPPEGKVLIGAGPFVAPFLARDLVPRIAADCPGLHLEIQVGYPEDLIADVCEGRLDFAVCHTEGMALPEALATRLVQRLHPACVVRAGHPLAIRAAAGEVLPATALAGLPVAGSRTFARSEHWLETMVGVPVPTGFVTADYDLVAEVLAGSDMYAIVPTSIAEWMVQRHALVAIDIEMLPYEHFVYLVEPRNKPLPPATRRVRKLLLETLAASPGGAGCQPPVDPCQPSSG